MDTIELPLQTRADVRLAPDTIDAQARTVELVWSTGAPVRRRDLFTGRRYDEVLYRHDAQPSGVKWVDGLRSSVRPMITYAFFLLFAAVKGSGLYLLIAVEGVALAEALPQVWDGETAALFAAVVSFWFGARSLAKAREGR